MATLQKAVADKFLTALKEQGEVEPAKLEKIEVILENGQRLMIL